MISRSIQSEVEKALQRNAAVAILGPRQVGKTTLALEVAKNYDSVYLDLESSRDRQKVTDPHLFFEAHKHQLVILDEIHRVPGLFPELRGIIDQGRREGLGKGRFLILGSASFNLLRQSGESLAGRITYLDLPSLQLDEIGLESLAREKLWVRGGFPESFLADSDHSSFEWRKEFIRTFLGRDVSSFGTQISAIALERLWTMVSHLQGQILNASHLARTIEVSPQSVTRYIDLLCELLVLRRLSPFHKNAGKRLVKSPKLYVRDSGLLHALLGIETLTDLLVHPVLGMSWEGFVIETLINALPWRATPFFYRTSGGAEMDLVIEFGNLEIWAIEIKRSPTSRPTKGFYHAREYIEPHKTFVLNSGEGMYPMSTDVMAIGLKEMVQLLKNA